MKLIVINFTPCRPRTPRSSSPQVGVRYSVEIFWTVKTRLVAKLCYQNYCFKKSPISKPFILRVGDARETGCVCKCYFVSKTKTKTASQFRWNPLTFSFAFSSSHYTGSNNQPLHFQIKRERLEDLLQWEYAPEGRIVCPTLKFSVLRDQSWS